jgi:putative MATE family efflux protein
MKEKKEQTKSLTDGAIYKPLILFMLPVILASFLQALYGAVDLVVIGQFTPSESVQQATAAVGTGSMIMTLITFLISGLTMGVTVALGKRIGQGDRQAASKVVGSAICIFVLLAVVLTAIMEIFAPIFCKWMNAPSVELTSLYIRICCAGLLFITAYNAISGIFRGIGNSKLPLLFVAVACVINIVLDIILVYVCQMGVAGVAVATISAQAVSVILSIIATFKIKLPFDISLKNIRFWKEETCDILKKGVPLALQDFLTNMSFVVINAVANKLGNDASLWSAIAAGYSVDNKLTSFIMVIPSSFLQSMSVFVAQNYGANKFGRIKKSLVYMLITAVGVGICLAALAFFGGTLLARIFTSDEQTIYYAAQYLKGFALDCLISCATLTFLGFFNGLGHSTFVMIQGLISAFAVRIPIVLIIGNMANAGMVELGLASSTATCAMLILGLAFYFIKIRKKLNKTQKEVN